ncbi:hypothetical protein EXIGLDRAFT_753526 [Exidia glandulosa HHB12029]|uniref:F-box domain-containing protein n=1 Tax=Exidia glandulosa HHB12029 TaxID=1314781 RepID=A0A165DNL2_EXIGL|nr:hypothetical protein EXIGLDRAFT_753526 [Exidia glandulosa HHB12029]
MRGALRLASQSVWLSRPEDNEGDVYVRESAVDAGALDDLANLATRTVASFKSRVNEKNPAVRLPLDILQEIGVYLNMVDLHSMRSACSAWRIGLDACLPLWNSLIWTCLPDDSSRAQLERDQQELDMWLSKSSKMTLYFTILNARSFRPYVATLERHQHRIYDLTLYFTYSSSFAALAILPTFTVVQSLEYQLGEEVVDSDVDTSDDLAYHIYNMSTKALFHHTAQQNTFPSLTNLVLSGIVFNTVMDVTVLRGVKHLQLRFTNWDVHLRPAWIVNAWASCPSLEVLIIVTESTASDSDRLITSALLDSLAGRVLNELVVDAGGYLGGDVLASLLKYLRAPSIRTDGTEAVDLSVVDKRGFMRAVDNIQVVGLVWDYPSAWKFVNSAQIRTINVSYRHWQRLATGVLLSELETLVVHVRSDDEACDPCDPFVAPNLRTVRFEVAVTADTFGWQPLDEDVAMAFIETLDPSLHRALRVEFNSWAKLLPADYDAMRALVKEIIME